MRDVIKTYKSCVFLMDVSVEKLDYLIETGMNLLGAGQLLYPVWLEKTTGKVFKEVVEDKDKIKAANYIVTSVKSIEEYVSNLKCSACGSKRDIQWGYLVEYCLSCGDFYSTNLF